MSKGNLDVVGIGNAIVDVLSKTDDDFLHNNGIRKGTMTLVEAAQAEALYAKIGPGMEVSGGSAANTAAALASLGSKAGFIGKVAHDQLGSVFRHDIQAAGVTFETAPLVKGVPTARCMVLITPDAQRTMNTYLGACVYLSPEDLDEEMISGAQVTYLEGYLFDRDNAKRAFYKAAQMAHKAKRKVALSLSDPFCVDRHREEFIELVNDHVDILFANEAEIMSLYKANDFEAAISAARVQSELCAITRSEKGSVIVKDGETIEIKAEPVAKVVDTTGAGDLYAAGFLHGYTSNRDLKTCGRMASVAAGEIIAQVGARPQRSLADLLKAKDAA